VGWSRSAALHCTLKPTSAAIAFASTDSSSFRYSIVSSMETCSRLIVILFLIKNRSRYEENRGSLLPSSEPHPPVSAQRSSLLSGLALARHEPQSCMIRFGARPTGRGLGEPLLPCHSGVSLVSDPLDRQSPRCQTSLPSNSLDLYRAPVAGSNAKLKFQSLYFPNTLTLKPFRFDYQDAFGKVIDKVPNFVNSPINQ
jgi:hypothetical protein